MAENTRVTITLSAVTADDLGVVSRTLGITRSALIAEILSMSAADLRAASLRLPYLPPIDSPIRLRGDSVEVIQKRIRDLWSALDAE